VRQVDRAKFVNLARKRVSRALKDIRLIGNLSNRSNYDFTENDVAAVDKLIKNLRGGKLTNPFPGRRRTARWPSWRDGFWGRAILGHHRPLIAMALQQGPFP